MRQTSILLIRSFCLLSGLAVGAAASDTWYIRPDGGSAVQCDGKNDAAYPGTGTAQPCAFRNPFFLWTNDPAPTAAAETPVWKIAGGDTVLIRQGDYRMGWKAPAYANTSWWNYTGCRGNNHGCSNPPIPPGTEEQPTRIVGEGWNAGCPAKPVLRGAAAVSAVLDLRNTSHVDVECLEFSDNDQCRLTTLVGEPYGCVNYTSDHGYWALQTNEATHHLLLRNLFIHGMSSAGILGNIGGNVVAENIYMRGNGNFGWDFDPGAQKPSVGPLSLSKVTIEWSACVERFPLADPVIIGCYDQAGANANGDALGFVDLDGDITIDQSIIRFNQQDGLDALYVKSGKTLKVTNSQFYGNNGQQIKTGGAANTIIQNNLVIGNCERQTEGVAGVTADGYNKYEKSFCRGEDFMALLFKAGTSMRVENNTLITLAPTAFNVQCRRIMDIFNSTGRVAHDGSVDASLATDGVRTSFPTLSPITNILMTAAVYVYPKSGSRKPKYVGQVGRDTACVNGNPCQFWYNPGTNELYQDPTDKDGPVLGTDELRVEYQYLGYCDDVHMSFRNNIVRGYPRRSTGFEAGGFWIYNFNAGVMDRPEQWQNNLYCGIRSYKPFPTESYSTTCPGTYFAAEPLTMTGEADLDALDPHLNGNSPAIGAGQPISDMFWDIEGNPRPQEGGTWDLGALQLTALTGPPTGLWLLPTDGGIVVYWDRTPGASYYRVQKRSIDGSYDQDLAALAAVAFNDVSGTTGQTYCYRVRAVNTIGTSDWSQEACVVQRNLPPE